MTSKRAKRANTINRNGRIIWEGLSRLTGDPIVCIATGYRKNSSNGKTGYMIQTWIIPMFEKARIAVNRGADSAVCGDCKHRGIASGGKGTCYVRIDNAPRAVYECYARGGYAYANVHELAELNRDRAVRIGSYGDPAAIPLRVWRWYVKHASTVTGYTHAWRNRRAFGLQRYVMASVDSISELHEARAAGWRTFRVRSDSEIQSGEIGCPAAKESGHKTTCDRCGLCNGTRSKARVSITIQAHGATASRFVEFTPTLKIAA